MDRPIKRNRNSTIETLPVVVLMMENGGASWVYLIALIWASGLVIVYKWLPRP